MSTEIAPREPELEVLRLRGHTPEQFEIGLMALVAAGGNAQRASDALKSQGHDLNRRTLTHWRNEYPRRYQTLAAKYAKDIEPLVETAAREVALAGFQVAQAAIEAAQHQLDAGEVKDPGTLARNMATSSAIAVDKVLAISGRNVVQHVHDVKGDIRILERLGVVEGVVDAEVVDER